MFRSKIGQETNLGTKLLFAAALIIPLLLGLQSEGRAQMKDVPHEIAPVDAPFPMPELSRPSIPDQTFDIRDYGAKQMSSDPNFKNTDAIFRTIEAANKAGGGTVLIPEGKWLTGPIHLKSNINLHVAEGATVLFSTDKEDYLPVVRTRYEGVEAYNYSPMVYAAHLKNVAITGKGTLDAQGDHWWKWFEEHDRPPRAIATQQPLSRRIFGKGAEQEGMRPSFLLFWKSENILVEGITLKDTPMWNVHLTYSKNIIVRDVTINSLRAPNGDGVVLDSSEDALVEYNHFQTGDDAVVLKSGFNEEGIKIDIPTQNVVVRNFVAKNVRTGSGGIVFGSETSGGINNVYVHDAYFEGTDRGIRFKTERGRGNIIENIFIRDVEMKDIENEAINFNTFYTGPGATGPSPLIRNIKIRDIKIDKVPSAIVLVGLPEKWLENILMENISIKNAEEGIRVTRTKGLTLKNVDVESQKQAMVVHDAYQCTFDHVSLSDDAKGPSVRFEGEYTGSIVMPDYPRDDIELADGLSDDIILEQPKKQTW